MSRIRSIHPGIFTDEAFMTLTVECPMAIPLLLGLWTEADDAGAFEWKPLTIKARILPAAAANVSDLLTTLVGVGFIMSYEVEGKRFGSIRNFVRYQRPKDPKDVHPFTAESRAYAGFNSDGTRPNATTGRKSLGTTSEPLPKSPENSSEISAQMEDGGGKREEKKESMSETSSDAPTLELTGEPEAKPKPKRKQIVYPADFEAFWRGYPNVTNNSKDKALENWLKLDPLDRIKAQQSLPAFVAYCRKDPTYKPIHVERYLSYRRFDGFASSAPTAQANSPQAMTDDRWRGLVKAYISTGGNWPWRDISPEIGRPGCKVPRAILEEFRADLKRIMWPEYFDAAFVPELAGAAE